MNDAYLAIANGFEQLAAGYRALADERPAEKTTPTTEPHRTEDAAPVEDTPPKEVVPNVSPTKASSKQPTIAEVRALLADKSQAGKQMEVKNLLFKYDSGMLSGVKPEYYAALMADAEAL